MIMVSFCCEIKRIYKISLQEGCKTDSVDIKPLSLDFQEKNEASVRVAKETTIYSKSGTGLQKHIFKN